MEYMASLDGQCTWSLLMQVRLQYYDRHLPEAQASALHYQA